MLRWSVEAEYRAILLCIYEVLRIRGLLKVLGLELNEPTKIHCDNKVAFSISHNSVQHDITKHVEVDWHFKEKIEARKNHNTLCIYTATTCRCFYEGADKYSVWFHGDQAGTAQHVCTSLRGTVIKLGFFFIFETTM